MASNRSLGFSLEWKATKELETKADRLKDKLIDLAKAIKGLKDTPIQISQNFDIKGLADVSKLLEKFSKTGIDPALQNQIKALQKEVENLKTQLVSANTQIDKFKAPKLSTAEVDDFNQTMKEVGMTTQQVEKHILDLAPALKTMNTPEADKLFLKITEIKNAIQSITATKKVVGLAIEDPTARTAALAELTKQEAALKAELVGVNKESKEYIKTQQAIANSTPKDSIIGLELELTKLNNQMRRMSQAERESASGKEIQKSFIEKKLLLNKYNEELLRFQHNVGNYKSAFSGIAASIGGVSNILTGGLIGGGILATFGAIKAFGQGSVREFTQVETAIAKIKQQLIVTGNQSGKTAEQFRDIALSLEVATGIESDQILNDVTSTLLRFTSIQGEAFDRAQKSALDLATTLGTDLKSAATIVGKALEDPEHAVGKLAKAGIVLDQQTKKNISSAIKQNDTNKASVIILEALESRTKGVADAVQNSTLKNVRSLNVFIQNIKEGFGNVIIGTLNTTINLFKDIANGVNIFSSKSREFERGINNFERAAAKEITTITTLFNILKSETAARESKNKAIAELVGKYPGLLNQMDLEYASIARLEEIQRILTSTVIKETGERLKVQAQAAIIERAINKQREKDRIEAGIKTQIQLTDDPRRKANLEKNLKAQTRFIDTQIAALKKEAEEAGKEISGATENILNSFRAIITDKSEEVKSKLTGLITESFIVLTDENATKKAKAAANKIRKELGGIFDDFVTQGKELPEAELVKLLDRINILIPEFNKARSGATGAGTKLGDEAIKAYEDQLKRIQELRDKFNITQAGLINNDFDREIEQLKVASVIELRELNETFKGEQEELKKLLDLKAFELQSKIDDINKKRKEAIDKFKQELIDARSELITLISETNTKQSQAAIDTELFNQDKKVSELKHSYEQDILNLDIALRDKQISQQEYDKQSLILTGVYSANVEKEVRRSNKVLAGLYEEQFRIRKASLEQQAKIDIAQTTKTFQSDVSDIDPNASTQQKLQAVATYELKRKAAIEAIEKQHASSVLGINQELQKELQALKDNELAAHKANAEAKTLITKKEAKAIENAIRIIAGIRIELKFIPPDTTVLEEIKRHALQLANDLSNAISTIERGNSEANFDKRKSDLEHEYDNRIKLAKGNTAEIERIEREKDQKLKALEREQSKRRKEQAIREAIINGALAVLNALSTVKPFLPLAVIAAGFAAATTAIQIAVIKSQKFAKGGRIGNKPGDHTGFIGSQAPPDETGQRPIPIVAHDGEHMSTARQVSDNPDLYKIIEDDRLRTNAGQRSKLTYDLIKFAEIKKQALYGQRPNPVPVYTPIIPYIKPSGSSSVTKIEFTDEQLDRMADILADRIASKTGSAVFEGSSQGITNASKEAIREEIRLQKSQV